MSSVIKSPFVSFSEQKKTIEVISSNDAKIINPNSYTEPLHNNEDISHEYEDYSSEEETEITQEQPEKIAEDIIAQANLQAEQIIAQAKENAMIIENDANEKGFNEGYTTGKEQALIEVEELKQKLKEEVNEAIEERNLMNKKMQRLIAEIIQKLVINLVGIQKIEPEVILFLIRMGLEEVDLYGDLIIKVSHEDFDEVIKHKDHLTENMSDKVSFEILKDPKLKKNDCIIDTSLGSVNCSLDERMEGLLRQLRLIEKSYSTNEENC